MNKMTMFLLVTLFPSFSYGSFPTVAELCNAGAQLFCCRSSKLGTDVFPRVVVGSQKSYTSIKQPETMVIDLSQISEEKKEAAFARYNKIINCGLYDKVQVDAGTIKSSLITQETIQIALAYKQYQDHLNSVK